MSDPLTTLCRFASEIDFDALPDFVRHQAKLVSADTIGVIVAGSAEPQMCSLSKSMLNDAPGSASVLGSGRRGCKDVAAFLNGCAGTFLELDEGNRFTRGHPAMHVLPALLSVAEATQACGSAFLRALVLGYEISARIAIGARLRASTHPHGTWGTVGAAAAVANLAGATPAQMREVINVATTLGLANSAQAMYEGALVRNSFAGFAARNGMTAWQLVQAGFTGERDALSSVWGAVLSDEWDPQALTDELGTRWEITRNYFKLHACCRYNHAALDALAQISATHQLTAREIKRVDVVTYSMAARLDDTAPTNTLAAKFSVPFSVATTVVTGSSGLTSFDGDAIRDPRTAELAKRVYVREDVAMTNLLPEMRPANVTVTLNNGARLEGSTNSNRGDFDYPYAPDQLKGKFFALIQRVWPRDVAVSMWQRLQSLDELVDVNTLTDLLTETSQSKSLS
jgi:2-methylcitrate dehydratase PrpD